MKKIGLLFLSVFCLCLVGCGEEEKEQTRQGIYYPVGLSHGDGEQTLCLNSKKNLHFPKKSVY